MEDKNKQKEILDSFGQEVRKKALKRRFLGKFTRRFGPLRYHLIRFTIFASFVFFVLITFGALTSSPGYTDRETTFAEVRLRALIDTNAGVYKDRMKSALALLTGYPEFYRKVVNNIEDIEVRSGICPTACIYTQLAGGLIDYILHETGGNAKILILNPSGYNSFSDDIEFASMLVHETDHVEYTKSSRMRRMALFVKCAPIFNPSVSLDSPIPSIRHRISPIEICAIQQQSAFHEASGTESGLEFKNGLIYNLFKAMGAVAGMFISFFR